MNNGQPPYGTPSGWGQQPPQQSNPGQYPVQPGGYNQPMYGQQPVNPGYEQAPTYQQQPHPQQQTWPQQTWQPYGQQPEMQQGYQQPQQTWQPYPQEQMYQQPQQPVYPPYNQPLQQGYQQPQQTWQAQPQQPVYPQFNQQGQPVHAQQGYGQGYISEPAQNRFVLPYDVVARVVLFAVLPLLFLLAMLLGSAALKWVFLLGAIGGIAMMWLRDAVSPNLRLTLSLVYGALAVVALVGALNGAPVDQQNSLPGASGYGQQTTQQGGSVSAMNQQQPTEVPTPTPSPTPDPYAVTGAAVDTLKSFFHFWSTNNEESMLALCAPSWRADQNAPQQALFLLKANRTPQDDMEVVDMTGTDADTIRVATVEVTVNKNNNKNSDRYALQIRLVKEDNVWYVDPQSMESYEEKISTPTPATENAMATQPVLYEGTATTVLYYNKDGGKKYHIDPDCPSVNAKYKPMASFYFSQLNDSPYSSLENCTRCGAPRRSK